VDAFPPSGAPADHRWKRSLYVKAQDVRHWAHPEDVQIDIFAQYGWWNFVEPVASLDPQTRLLTLKKDCGYDLHPHNRYHFQNALEELDAPEEWFYDRHSGWLYYWPSSGLDGHEVRVPTIDHFFKIRPGAKQVRITGLTLTGCEGAAIQIEGAEDCVVDHCVITQVGGFSGSGISVTGGKKVRISRNEVSYTGSTGVSLSGGDRKTLIGPGHVAEDNHIHHVGVFNKNGCGIGLTGVDLIAQHNHIHDGPRMGVQMSGNNIKIEYNHMHHLVQETQDGGAIYTGGRDWIGGRGCSWSYNRIHDIIGCGQESTGLKHPWFSFGLYPDDNTGGVDIIGNLVYRIAYTPIHMHNSRDCRVENNVFALGERFQFDLHGWSKEHRFLASHMPTMIDGYESIKDQPAWRSMRNMDLHPRDSMRADGTMMSGNVVERNIMFSHAPGIKYSDLRSCSAQWNVINHNLAWASGHPVVTGINKVGADKGDALLIETFDGLANGKLPKGWGFNHRAKPTVQLAVMDGVLHADMATSNDPRNAKTVFHGQDVPIRPGAAYRMKLRIKSTLPSARVSLAFASFKNGEGYWQTSGTSVNATTEWQEVTLTGRMLQENAPGWKPWMKAFWLRVDCHESEGQVMIDDLRLHEAEALDEWRAWQGDGWDLQSLVADPLFVGWQHDDWRLQPESPAFKLGFKALPIDQMGIRPE
jgi:Right handed beta helix region